MIIHVVEQGRLLIQLPVYGISAERLALDNGIDTQINLAVKKPLLYYYRK